MEMRRESKPLTSYPAVERLIDSEEFGPVNKAFETAYKELGEFQQKKKGLKKSRDAKKAMTAIEHVVDLFKELLKIKYELATMLERAAASKKKR